MCCCVMRRGGFWAGAIIRDMTLRSHQEKALKERLAALEAKGENRRKLPRER